MIKRGGEPPSGCEEVKKTKSTITTDEVYSAGMSRTKGVREKVGYGDALPLRTRPKKPIDANAKTKSQKTKNGPTEKEGRS